MRCPKCDYLGFEQADRCRNCGYEFALASRRSDPELVLRDEREVRLVDDLDLSAAPALGGGRPTPATADRPSAAPLDAVELPLFTDDVPLITKLSPPRPPLAVRRATPEVPKLRSERPRAASLSFQEPELQVASVESPLAEPPRPDRPASGARWTASAGPSAPAAGLGARFVAALLDLALLAAVDGAVLYFTLQICGLTAAEIHLLPLGPLLAFLVVQNGGYFVALTVGGQTIGKMLTGIRVVASESGQSLDLGRALQRTLLWTVMVLPAGLGLLTALLSPERRGLHDRFAGTKVVRAVVA